MSEDKVYSHIANGGLTYDVEVKPNNYKYLMNDDDQLINSKILELVVGTNHFGVETSYTIPILDKETLDKIVELLQSNRDELVDKFKKTGGNVTDEKCVKEKKDA